MARHDLARIVDRAGRGRETAERTEVRGDAVAPGERDKGIRILGEADDLTRLVDTLGIAVGRVERAAQRNAERRQARAQVHQGAARVDEGRIARAVVGITDDLAGIVEIGDRRTKAVIERADVGNRVAGGLCGARHE